MSKSLLSDAIRIHCPCANSPADAPPPNEADSSTVAFEADQEDEEQTRRVFDPFHPRAKYSLHPIGYLYFCQECQAIRCPRCVQEEIVSAFCPMCFFEVPLTSIKADGNRCVRNCFQCPICFSGLHAFANDESQGAPYTLNCTYCQWSSSEIDVEFEKATGIYGQLSKLPAPHSQFQAEFEGIREHYANLFDSARPSEDPMSSFSSRYANLLSGKGSLTSRKSGRSLYSRMRPPSRDSDEKPLEYEQVEALEDESELVSKLQSLTTLEETASMIQSAKQLGHTRWEKELWPISLQLRTKRSKRCRACRHILVKPENKPTSTRFRIKMLALNYIPTIHVRPYVPAGSSPSLFSPFLSPNTTHSFILTVINPLYDPIRVTLSTTAKTPGPYQHAVTILRPEFSVGANADIWNDEDEIIHSPEKEKRKSRFGIFEARRNTISIFMEVVPENPSSATGEQKVDVVPEGKVPIEIPIFVKMTYLSEDMEKDDTLTLVNQVLGEEKGKGKVEREIGYWVVVKVGNIKVEQTPAN